jgi:hypothetical protein
MKNQRKYRNMLTAKNLLFFVCSVFLALSCIAKEGRAACCPCRVVCTPPGAAGGGYLLSPQPQPFETKNAFVGVGCCRPQYEDNLKSQCYQLIPACANGCEVNPHPDDSGGEPSCGKPFC